MFVSVLCSQKNENIPRQCPFSEPATTRLISTNAGNTIRVRFLAVLDSNGFRSANLWHRRRSDPYQWKQQRLFWPSSEPQHFFKIHPKAQREPYHFPTPWNKATSPNTASYPSMRHKRAPVKAAACISPCTPLSPAQLIQRSQILQTWPCHPYNQST